MAAYWEKVATSLHFQQHNIWIIKRDYPNQCESACRSVFLKWLASTAEDDRRQPVTWNTLVEVLIEIDLSEVATELMTIIAEAVPMQS